MLKQSFLLFLILFIFSCSKDEKVFTLQSGDINKSCAEIAKELEQIKKRQIPKEKFNKKLKVVKNVLVGIVMIPTSFISSLFFDFDKKEQTRINDLDKRYKYLEDLATYKQCG